MPAITTQDLRISNADLFDKLVTENSTYVALSHTSEWDDEQLPPDVFDCIEDRVLSYKELVGMKKLLATNIRSVIPRINWEYNTVYD